MPCKTVYQEKKKYSCRSCWHCTEKQKRFTMSTNC